MWVVGESRKHDRVVYGAGLLNRWAKAPEVRILLFPREQADVPAAAPSIANWVNGLVQWENTPSTGGDPGFEVLGLCCGYSSMVERQNVTLDMPVQLRLVTYVAVAQWIEQPSPKGQMQVRFLLATHDRRACHLLLRKAGRHLWLSPAMPQPVWGSITGYAP